MCMACVITGKMTAKELSDKQLEIIKAVDAQARLGHDFIKVFRTKLEENKFTPYEIGQMYIYELAYHCVENNFDVFMIIEELKSKYMNFLEIALNKSQKIEHPERFDENGKRKSTDNPISTCPNKDDILKNMDIDDMAKA